MLSLRTGVKRCRIRIPRRSAQYNFTGTSAFQQITLLQLATHTSGMPDEDKSTGKASYNLFHDLDPSAELINYWTTFAPVNPIGECWLYSSLGFVTLGYAVTQMYGEPEKGKYNAILERYFTGMKSDLLRMPHTGAIVQDDWMPAKGYVRDKDQTEPASGIAADLKSSGHDMLTFIKAQLNQLDPAPNPVIQRAISATQDYHGEFPKCGKPKAPEMKMGLGWQIVELDGRRMLTKNGASGLGGQSCAICLLPDILVGISVLTNQVYRGSSRPSGTSPTAVAREILSELHPSSAPLLDRLTEQPEADG